MITDKFPSSIEAPYRLFLEYSEDIALAEGERLSVNDPRFNWETTFQPNDYTSTAGIRRKPHVWMRWKVGVTGSWQGPAKLVGRDGYQGSDGIKGDPGPQGPSGPAGLQTIIYTQPYTFSYNALSGNLEVYKDGVLHNAFYIKGAAGPQGIQGLPGSQGPQGPMGNPFQAESTGNIFTGTNIAGLGLDNYSGRTTDFVNNPYFHIVMSDNRSGAKDGTVGNESPVVNIVGTSIPTNDLSGHLIAYNGTSWVDYGLFTGVKGDLGATGPTGPQGEPGVPGLDGKAMTVFYMCPSSYNSGNAEDLNWKNNARPGDILILRCP